MNQRTIDEGNLGSLLGAHHGDPFAVLGMHQAGDNLVVRVFRPDVREVVVEDVHNPQRCFHAARIHDAGFFEALITDEAGKAVERFEYQLRLTSHEGVSWTDRDPYSYGQLFGEIDLHLFCEGNHWQLYEKMGAHLLTVGGVRGTLFAVWAPNAQRISVVGDWNHWDGRTHPMRKHPSSGVWEIFIPGVKEGAHYKFEIKGCHGNVFLKSDHTEKADQPDLLHVASWDGHTASPDKSFFGTAAREASGSIPSGCPQKNPGS